MRPKCDNWPNVRSIWDTLIKGALHEVHETVKIQKPWRHVMIDGERGLEVSLEAAARFTLRRHHLVERAPVERMLEVVDDVMGLNAQGAFNYQLSLWNRVRRLTVDRLPNALYEERCLIRSWFMRDTVHIVPARSYSLFRRGLERSLMQEWNRWTVKTGRKQAPDSWEPLYTSILEALEGSPLTLNRLMDEVGQGIDKPTLIRVVREMSLRGRVCHAASKGPWHHSTEHSFARVDRWLPDSEGGTLSGTEALTKLAVRYLRSYGPASFSDFAYWTGARVHDVKPAFREISDLLTEVLISGQRGTYLMLKEDVPDLTESDPEPFARLLPQFDALIMGHRDKTRFIDQGDRGRVFLPRADVAATILVNERVTGTWSIKKSKENRVLTLMPSRKLSAEESEMVEAEVEGMRDFTGFQIEIELIPPQNA